MCSLFGAVLVAAGPGTGVFAPGAAQAASAGSVPVTLTLEASSPSQRLKGTVVLTVTASSADAPIAIVDTDSHATITSCGTGTLCSTTVTSSTFATHTYQATMGTATSNVVSVTWVRPVMSLTATPKTLDPLAFTSLTATSTVDTAGGFTIQIVDTRRHHTVATCATGTVCNASEAHDPGLYSYQAQLVTAGTARREVVSRSRTITVTWTKPWVLLVGPSMALLSGKQAFLTTFSSFDVTGGPYVMHIVDKSTGTIVAACTTGTMCATSVVNTATTKSRSTHVYVAQLVRPSPLTVIASSKSLHVSWIG